MTESPPLVVVSRERDDSVSSTESGQGDFDTQNLGPQYRCSCSIIDHTKTWFARTKLCMATMTENSVSHRNEKECLSGC